MKNRFPISQRAVLFSECRDFSYRSMPVCKHHTSYSFFCVFGVQNILKVLILVAVDQPKNVYYPFLWCNDHFWSNNFVGVFFFFLRQLFVPYAKALLLQSNWLWSSFMQCHSMCPSYINACWTLSRFFLRLFDLVDRVIFHTISKIHIRNA